jgi:hypothetical protein
MNSRKAFNPCMFRVPNPADNSRTAIRSWVRAAGSVVAVGVTGTGGGSCCVIPNVPPPPSVRTTATDDGVVAAESGDAVNERFLL